MAKNRKNLNSFFDMNSSEKQHVTVKGTIIGSAGKGIGQSGNASGLIIQTLPQYQFNGVTFGGETLEIFKSWRYINLELPDGTRKKIRTQGEAQEALKLVCSHNHSCLKDILLKNGFLVKTLEELKEKNLAVKNLYLQINKLKEHAVKLKELDAERASVTIALADNLKVKADQFLSSTLDKIPTKQEFASFEKDFKALADSQEPLLGRHRAILQPIIANILLALTGVGAVLIAGKLIYKAITSEKLADLTFNNSFFFAETRLQSYKNQAKDLVNSDLVDCESSASPALN